MRSTLCSSSVLAACSMLAATLATPVAGQIPPVGSREAMWPAPTAEDWAKPCLIGWQRSYEDALAVAEETGKPILVVVNMDGEIASEHYAGVRYRQPEIAALYEPYVTVIASVYRHTPRDYDEEGRRILCPRFGSVTCGEHIAIEPGLFEQFFEGQRVAPRHIGVELDKQEMYDVYYAFDTDSVFEAIRAGAANRDVPIREIARDDRPVLERVESRHNDDQTAVEQAYLAGDRELRRRLLQAAVEAADATSVDLLRLAVFGFDSELSRLARQALARSNSPAAIDLIAEALRVPMEPVEREALLAALERLGEASPRARTLAVVFRGLSKSSRTVDVERWRGALGESEVGARPDWRSLEARVEGTEAVTEDRPADAAAYIALAEASLELAVDPETALVLAADARAGSTYQQLMFEDVRRAALHAEELGARDWRLDAALAVAAYRLGDRAAAYERAESAVKTLPAGDTSWSAMAALQLFAEARQRSIWGAVREKREWPGEWLTDVHAAYSVLARHPLGSDAQVVTHFDFLQSLGASEQASRVLDDGLGRYPESWVLHDRLRARALREKGVEGLESVYETWLRELNAPANLEWFAGYASLVAAEYHRRRGNMESAGAAYERAIGHYERNVALHAESRASADHYVALAIAGRARIAFEAGDDELAMADVLAAFERCPDAASSPDGLGFSPVMTANMLRARLDQDGRKELVASLDAALAALDPKHLELPLYERGGPPLPERGRGTAGGGGRRGAARPAGGSERP